MHELSELFRELEDEEFTSFHSSEKQEVTSQKNKSHLFYEVERRKPRPENIPFVGLLNQGATCYLNSLIQCLYMTPEFKNGIFKLNLDELGINTFEEVKMEESIEEKNTENVQEEKKEIKQVETEAEKNNLKNKSGTEKNFIDFFSQSESEFLDNFSDGDLSRQDKIKHSEVEYSSEEIEIISMLSSMGIDENMIKKGIQTLGTKDANQLAEWCLTMSSSEFPNTDTPKRDDMNVITSLFYEIEEKSNIPLSTFESTSNSIEINQKIPLHSEFSLTSNETAQKQSNSKLENKPILDSKTEADKKLETNNVEKVADIIVSKGGKKPRKILIELQRLFAFLQLSNQYALSTENLTNSFGWKGSEVLQQHDVHELNRILFDVIDRSLQTTSQQSLIRNLYRGTFVNKIICLSCNNTSEREEEFQDVQIIVKGFQSLEESLRNFVTFETLSGENKYQCDYCSQKSDAKKGVIFRELPKLIIFSLIRFEYNWEQDARKKIFQNFEFPTSLNMNSFCELNSSVLLYDLFAVVIHQGGAYGGHYHAYIRDFSQTKEPIWYDFDDSQVTQIPISKLESQFGGSKECAYMLIYRNREQEVPSSEPLPEELKKQIEKYNLQIAIEREKYENEFNQINIQIVTSENCCVEDETLKWKHQPFENFNQSFGQLIKIDQRKSIEELLKEISIIFPDYDLSKEKLVFTELFVKGNIIHILRSLPSYTLESSLKANLFRDDGIFLIWNGKNIGETIWNGMGPKITIDIHFFTSDVEEVFQLTLSETFTLFDFQKKLSALTSITIEEQRIWKINFQTSKLTVYQKNDLSKTLFELGIETGTQIGIQSKNEEDHFAELRNNVFSNKLSEITIFFLNHLEGGSEVSQSLSIDPFASILELKKKILDTIQFPGSIDQVHLARWTTSGEVGAPFKEELTSIQDCGLDDESRVVLLEGIPPSDMLTLRFLVVVDGKPTSRIPYQIRIHKESTILDLKALMAAQIYKPPEEFRLRKTDVNEMPKELLSDDSVSLTQAKIKDNSLLWLEKGKIPIKGQISLKLQLYSPTNSSIVLNTELSTIEKDIFSYPLCSPLLHFSNLAFSSHFLIPLGELDFSSFQKLIELKELLINRQMVPTSSISQIRMWSGQRLLKKDQLSLKKLSVGDGSSLTVQVAPINEDSDPNAILLYVQKRNPETQSFQPGIELNFKGETLEALQNDISKIMDIPLSNLFLVKYNPFSHGWQFLPDPSTNYSNPSSIKLRNKPYNLRDGDLIICKYNTQVEDDFEKHEPPKLPVQIKKVPKEEKSNHHYQRTGNVSEPALSIHLEL